MAVQTSRWHSLPRSFRELAAQSIHSILLETARQEGDSDRSFLFLDPVQELTAWNRHELDQLLSELDRYLADGFFVAGFFSYECGEHLVGLPAKWSDQGMRQDPLARLSVFHAPFEFDHSLGSVKGDLPVSGAQAPQADDAIITTGGLTIAREDYDAAVHQIHRYLAAGDTYQVNFTDEVSGRTASSPLAVYETLLRQQPVSFAAFLNDPTGPILSFSPELFFRTSHGHIQVRPMKGTWPRGRDLGEDQDAGLRLITDEKNRSEHVMIVDLLRNDLGRICQYGSVIVEKLFQVERYKTLLQMTSTCSGVLRQDVSPSQVLATMFPSGSITGAPKRRAMEIIQELERLPRGIYTGAIGYFAPNGEACFNVAIRTLKLRDTELTMGVGGAIVADSKPQEEYEECNLKATFLSNRRPPFSLIETMRCVAGIPLLSHHIQRLSESADYFGIRYDQATMLSELESAITHCGRVESRVRMELNEDGQWRISATPMDHTEWHGRLILAADRTRSTDLFLRHKTTNRDIYDGTLTAVRNNGFDEVLFLNESGQLTEGAISNLFLRIGDTWITPPLNCGVLPGVQRKQLLKELSNVEEEVLHLSDLKVAEEIFLCNALRGIRAVASIESAAGDRLWQQ